jgi:hypothetical protein
MRAVRITVISGFTFVAASAFAATKLDFWHSYVHAQTKERHYSFHLAEYKRGLFWGSCGPSTKSLQWAFSFDLAGDGPVYSTRQFSVSDDNGKVVPIAFGQVATDVKRHTVKIDIEVVNGGLTNKFIGNGEYRIHQTR